MELSNRGAKNGRRLRRFDYGFTAVKTSFVKFTSTSVILQFLNFFASPSMFFTVSVVPSVFA
jgi:hypothetical protein